MRSLLLLASLVLAPAAFAQAAIENGAGDPRILTLNYGNGGILHVPTSPGTIQTLLFSQGEMIRSIILSDPAAYIVSVSDRGDSVTLRPNGPTSLALMNVRTDARAYEIELVASNRSDTPAVVRLATGTALASAPTPAARPAQAIGFAYRLSGNPVLRPSSIGDDGEKTYLRWADDRAMPAVFAIGPSGNEEMIDGYVRGGLFTIDRVHEQLVFRMDGQKAIAKRVRKKDRNARD